MDSTHSLEWQALEHEERPRSVDWYWICGASIIAAALAAIITNNLLLAIILVLGGFTYLGLASRTPEEVEVKLSPKGVVVKNQIFPYDTLTAFAVDNEPPRRRIVLVSATSMARHYYIPIDEYTHIDDVREYLLAYLPEIPYEPSFSDWVTEYL